MSEDRIRQLLSCSRPVLFERIEDDAFPYYSAAGTAFIAACGEFLYCASAEHVVRGQPMENLRIRVHDDADSFVALDHQWRPRDPTIDYRDFVLARVAQPVDDRLRSEAVLITPNLARAAMATLVPGRAMVTG